jgi:hypothetical protein
MLSSVFQLNELQEVPLLEDARRRAREGVGKTRPENPGVGETVEHTNLSYQL